MRLVLDFAADNQLEQVYLQEVLGRPLSLHEQLFPVIITGFLAKIIFEPDIFRPGFILFTETDNALR